MRPIALCLQRLDRTGSSWMRCVALPGGRPGLSIAPDATVEWLCESTHTRVQLWVTADGRLALSREADAPALVLRRARRTLEVPPAKPVIVLDGDRLETPGWNYRVSVHGPTDSVAAPASLHQRPARNLLRTTAAALAVAALGGQASATEPEPGDSALPDAPAESADGGLGDGDGADNAAPIEIRETPPAPPPPLHGGCCGTKPGYDTAFKK